MTVLESQITVRDHRPWDMNADNSFVTVWCGSQQAHAIVQGRFRSYECPDGIDRPGGTPRRGPGFSSPSDPHTQQLCESRKYLFEHMDDLAREALQNPISRMWNSVENHRHLNLTST